MFVGLLCLCCFCALVLFLLHVRVFLFAQSFANLVETSGNCPWSVFPVPLEKALTRSLAVKLVSAGFRDLSHLFFVLCSRSGGQPHAAC